MNIKIAGQSSGIEFPESRKTGFHQHHFSEPFPDLEHSIMSKSVDTLFWSSLGKKGPLLFGEECASAALWMFLALLQRCVLLLLRIEPYVPTGIIFAFPLLLQVMNSDSNNMIAIAAKKHDSLFFHHSVCWQICTIFERKLSCIAGADSRRNHG